MADILTFPQRTAEKTRYGFLKDEDRTLEFTSEDQSTYSRFHAFEEPDFFDFVRPTNKDWTNQELASLYRVKRLLDAAGVANHVDRGITDEGDPWFLFCHDNGEVFIHLCRLDGDYLLDSPNVGAPLRGRDFNGLIEDFTRRTLTASDASPADTSQRVVRLERNKKVYLHPSSMLAALIWTLFVASEELVMVIPEDTGDTVNRTDGSDPLAINTSEGRQDTELIKNAKNEADDEHDRHTNPIAQHLRDLAAQTETKVGHNNYAIGLSVIAISLGVMAETTVSEVDGLSLTNFLTLLENDEDTAGQGNTALTGPGWTPDGRLKFLDILNSFFEDPAKIFVTSQEIDKDMFVASAVQQVDNNDHATSMFFEEIKAFLSNIGMDLKLSLEPVANVARQDVPIVLEEDAQAVTSEADEEPGTTENLGQAALMLSRMSLGEEALTLLQDIQKFAVRDNTVQATFDITESALQAAEDIIASPDAVKEKETSALVPLIDDETSIPVTAGEITRSYDATAQAFIEFLIAKENDLEMIATDTEVIFLDPAVFEKNNDDSYVLSWTMDNGDVISTIGLRSDYEDFDLIV